MKFSFSREEPKVPLPPMDERKKRLIFNLSNDLDLVLADREKDIQSAVSEEKVRLLTIISKLENDFRNMYTDPKALHGGIIALQELRKRL